MSVCVGGGGLSKNAWKACGLKLSQSMSKMKKPWLQIFEEGMDGI